MVVYFASSGIAIMMPLCQFAGVIMDLGPDIHDSHERTAQSADSQAQIGQDTPKGDLQVGDHVLGACRFGSYATCLNVPTQQVQLPTLQQSMHVSHQDAADYCCTFAFLFCGTGSNAI